VALGGQVVDFVRLHLLDDAHQAGRVGQVTVVQDEGLRLSTCGSWYRWSMRSVLNSEAAALDAVHLVALLEQEFGQVGAVLAGDAGDEGDFDDSEDAQVRLFCRGHGGRSNREHE
jgi:hypothetical protein